MRVNLGQEHVESGLLSVQGKNGTILPDIPGTMTVFPVLALLFHPFLPKIWLSTYTKIIFLKYVIIGLFAGKVS